jgi:hypothetical protein
LRYLVAAQALRKKKIEDQAYYTANKKEILTARAQSRKEASTVEAGLAATFLEPWQEPPPPKKKRWRSKFPRPAETEVADAALAPAAAAPAMPTVPA